MSVRSSEIRLCVNTNTEIAGRRSIDPLTFNLPTEIVSEIFALTLWCPAPLSYSTFAPAQQEKGNGAALKLGAVCLAWREIAWATPQLWTNFYLHIDIDSHCNDNSTHNTSFQLANAWFARSGHLPLSLQIHVPLKSLPRILASVAGHSSFALLSSLITRYSSRWRELDIWCPDWFLATLFPTVVRAVSDINTTILDTLRIHAVYDPYHPTRAVFSGYAAMEPAPRHVSISGGTLRFVDVHVNWQNATRVDMEGVELAGCVYILTHALGLEDVKFNRVSVNETDVGMVSVEGQIHTTLSFLTSLHLDFTSSFLPSHNPLDDLLSVITAPALSRISLSFGILRPRALLPAIALIRRSGSAISSLAISRKYAGSRDNERNNDEHAQLLALLRATPGLRYLDVGVKFGFGEPHPQARLIGLLVGEEDKVDGGEEKRELELPYLEMVHIGVGRIRRVSDVSLFDWTTVPRLIGSLRMNGRTHLRISWIRNGVASDVMRAVPYWDRETVVRVMELQRWYGSSRPGGDGYGENDWIELDTKDTKGEVDLFEASVDFYGLRG
ncbi:hypothetical protein JR316_0010285 [Psilocybe cubensis]|uniref:F-box domain-containing protein n=2 Tax=Psilocybe cubensis TaxID=181762 RepID=A0A8H7XRW1_PSICU|nr:hypothetical protein JR316_0010285 [Psilocybe cubensis]KAH9478048.1 hypothetical protein JR316_0010285 [Psilocybe cubensis]